MLIWNSVIFIFLAVETISNHPLRDDADPEVVEARRTQVLSESTHFHPAKEDVLAKKEEVLSRGQQRYHTLRKETIDDNVRKDDSRKEDDAAPEEDQEENCDEVVTRGKSRSKTGCGRSRSQLDVDRQKDAAAKTETGDYEPKPNSTTKEVTAEGDEEFSIEKTGNNSHKNSKSLEPIRGRKLSSLNSSSTSLANRNHRTSHTQTVSAQEPQDDILLGSSFSHNNSSKKRRRPSTVSSSTTQTPQTMGYNLYNHFRPLDQDVPEDHLTPFLDFGKKLSSNIQPTPNSFNSIENRSSNRTPHYNRNRSNKERISSSTSLDEDSVLHEDMDVTVVKKAVERNNAPRGKVQQLRDPYISGYYRRRSTTSTTQHTTKSTENLVVPTTECSAINKDNSDEVAYTNSQNSDDSTKCDVIPSGMKTHKKFEQITSEKPVSRSNRTNHNSKPTVNKPDKLIMDTEMIDLNHQSTSLSMTSLRDLKKFERIEIEDVPTQKATNNVENKRTDPLVINQHLRSRMTQFNNATLQNERIKSTDHLLHQESNNYERNTSQPVTTLSPTPSQLTTRILSTAVVTSVSIKETVPGGSNKTVPSSGDISKKNQSSYEWKPPTGVATQNEKLNTKDNRNNSSDEFVDSTFSSSSTKLLIRPTEDSLVLPNNNMSVSNDSLVGNNNSSSVSKKPVSESPNSRDLFSSTRPPVYKPKILLPKTKDIISTTTQAHALRTQLPTKTTTEPNSDKYLTTQTSRPITEFATSTLPSSTTLIDTKESLNVAGEGNSTLDMTNACNDSCTQAPLVSTNINEEFHENQTHLHAEGLTTPNNDDDHKPVSTEMSPVNDGNIKTDDVAPSAIDESSLKVSSVDEMPNEDKNGQSNTDLEVIDPSTTEAVSNPPNASDITNKINKNVTISTLPPDVPVTPPKHVLDHKWSHGVGNTLKAHSNLTLTEGQDVGVAYQENVHIASYLLTAMGIIPILILAAIVARVVILRNRKKVLDESEYSSEYNRSPLSTSSPLPTKLPRVPAHMGWEAEKNPQPPLPVTSTRWEFPREKLRLQTVLGHGNFGQVWKAEADDISGHEGLTRLVAVKSVKEGASNKEREDLLRELGIMQELGAHPNVVTLLGCCTEKEPYFLIMEYVMYGKLLAFLRDHRTRAHYYNFSESTDALTSRDLTVFAYCVARGMDYLTTKAIIHRDLAARNILVDHNKLCKIADFGMSRNVRDTGQIYEQKQSKGALPIRWMAPESLHFSLFTHKTDVWSFGILMWEIVTLGSTPYANMGGREVMRRVRDGYRLDRPSHCHQELFRVIQRCWHSEPAKRPTFAELKQELGQLLGDSEHGGGYVDLEGLAEEIKHHNLSATSTLQRPN